MNHQPFRFQVGDFECMLVIDGAYGDQNPYWGLLIDTGRQRVLADTGAGNLVPGTGQLIPNLRAAGIAPTQIDIVVLTHAHLDHTGGIVDAQGKLAFSNARYVMSAREYGFWPQVTDFSWMPFPASMVELFRSFVAQQITPLQPELIEGEVEIVPGIQAILAPGHTPGHIALNITSAGERLLYLVDTVIEPSQVAQPDEVHAVDYDASATIATRRRLFQQAVQEQARVLVFHFPFPGLGYIAPAGAGWQWHPLCM